MYVCLWSPDWSTDGASTEEVSPRDVAPFLAELAPRLRVEAEVIWADGRGLDAAALAERLLECLEDHRVRARAGVGRMPVAAELAARWSVPSTPSEVATPFLVKERTGWGWRSPSQHPHPSGSAPTPPHLPSGPLPSAHHPSGGARGGGEAGDPARSEREGTPSPAIHREASGSGTPRHPPLSARDGAAAGNAATRREPGRSDEPSHPPSGEVQGRVAVVEGTAWMHDLPVGALRPEDRLKTLLDGVGIATIGDLAALEREAVEVRFGAGAVELWRLARGDDRRRLFVPVPPERPHGSIDFVDYVLTDPSRLLFTVNALLGPICDRLGARGEHARTLRLTLPLANGDEWARTLRPARPTASRETWLRLIRGLLERLTVPDAVAGMHLEVGSTEAAAVHQGDLFDRGFATASAVEAAVTRLAERQVLPVAADVDAHPLVERRGKWRHPDTPHLPRPVTGKGGNGGVGNADTPAPPRSDTGKEGAGALGLQLLPSPRRVAVETDGRRDHDTPTRLRERGRWRAIEVAAGPDRISGGQWEPEPYAREYWRCVTEDGALLWLYRDALDGGWYLHGQWD